LAIDADTESFVQQRLARARDYGVVVLDAVGDLLYALGASDVFGLGDVCTCEHLRQWREVAGYTDVRPPALWQQPMVCHDSDPLAQRLLAQPDATPSDLEHVGDLLWYAELADAVAQLDGHRAALVEYGDARADGHRPARRRRRADAPARGLVPLAIAGAAD
jgi:hypothetical protein